MRVRTDHPQRLGRVEVIIDHFHLPFRHPIHARDGVQRKPLLIKQLGRRNHLSGATVA